MTIALPSAFGSMQHTLLSAKQCRWLSMLQHRECGLLESRPRMCLTQDMSDGGCIKALQHCCVSFEVFQ